MIAVDAQSFGFACTIWMMFLVKASNRVNFEDDGWSRARNKQLAKTLRPDLPHPNTATRLNPTTRDCSIFLRGGYFD
jgi:hypothetical protein